MAPISPILKTKSMSFRTPRSTGVVTSQTSLDAPQSNLCRRSCRPSSSLKLFSFDFEHLTMIIKSDSERASGLLFWVLEPFVKAIPIPSENHFIFGIILTVQWKALTDPNS